MIESLGRIAAVALIVVLFAALLKKTSPAIAIFLPIAFAAFTLYLLTEYAGKIVAQVENAVAAVGLSEEYFLPLFKVVAIAVISKTLSDICRDAEQSAVGNLVETAGAFVAIVLTMPLFSAAWELLQELL